LFLFLERHRLQVHFEVEVLAELPVAMRALIFLYASMRLQMLVQIAHLAEGCIAICVTALIGFFLCMNAQMGEKLAHSLDNFAALSISFGVAIMALEKPVLLLLVALLLDEIENKHVTVWYVVRKAKFSGVEVSALNYCDLVARNNFVSLHKVI
jgi:hypothetical protein